MFFAAVNATPTREIWGNITPWMQVVFYVMINLSIASLGWQIWRRAQLWKQGREGGFERDWRVWLDRIIVFALGQKRVHKKSLGAVLHLLLFSGFVVLTIGTTLLAIADKGPVNFHKGWYYLFYELTMDVFGVAFCVGCLMALYRRAFRRPKALGHQPRDWALLGLLLGLGVTGFALEAFRLHYTQPPMEIARWSIVAWLIDSTLLQGMTVSTARGLHLTTWWTHAIMVAAFFACIPVTRFVHAITGPVNIAARPLRPMGELAALKMEEVEATGRIGVSTINEFNRQQLLSLDACMECGRCEEACPAWASGKPLTPKGVVLDLRRAMAERRTETLHGAVIAPETLWSCTMCQACVQECPVLIGQVDLISDLRRHLVGEGEISGPPAKAMADIGKQFNPFGRPARDRMAWAAGLNAPTVEENPNYEYLLWVGCAASFDPRAQKVARALTQLMTEAKVNFAVLGKEERCTGDPARRLGDEFLFQESANRNIQTLNKYKARRIVTPCPHCLNTLKNEYRQFGGDFDVQHHTQFLAELTRSGRLAGGAKLDGEVTFHDPCYLARANQEIDAPREVLRAATGKTGCEMPRHGKKTFCCGAGGGRMFFEEAPEQRVSRLRAKEAIATGAKTVATGCPFCLNMMADGVASTLGGENVRVADVAELLLEARTKPAANS